MTTAPTSNSRQRYTGEPAGPLGFILPPASPGDGSAGALGDMCRDAESAGAGALWAIDHLFWPVPMVESLTALAVAAATTSRATLGTCVLQLPLRNSGVVAKQAANLQLLSGGRLVLGVGVGSHRGEYERLGADFARRGRALDAGIDDLRAVWAEEGPGWGQADPYVVAPSPRPIPVWVGGSSDAARERAALRGDGWIPLFIGVDEYAHGLSRLQDRQADVGRHPEDVTPSVVVIVRVGPETEAAEEGLSWLSRLYGIPPKAFRRHLISGSAEACAAGIQAYRDAGAHHVAALVASDRGVVEQFAAIREAMALHDGPSADELALSGATA